MTHPPTDRRRDLRTGHTLARVQATSGLIFAAFLSIHLLNIMLSALGPDLYDAFQGYVRPIYQWPPIELGVLMPALVVHIGVGVVRMRRRSPAGDLHRRPLRTRLHRMSAYFLLAVIFGHIAATRLPSLVDGVWLGFAGLSFTMDQYGAVFYPYYMLLGVSGLYHGGYGSLMALRMLGVRLPTRLERGLGARAAFGVGAGLVGLGVLSVGGMLYEIDDPTTGDFARYVHQRFGITGSSAPPTAHPSSPPRSAYRAH